MISILIPVYNTQIVPLVGELSRQLHCLDIEGEIVVFDDCSSSKYRQSNAAVKGLSNVLYKELESNYGRTAIRQLLAAAAKYEWLLFLDGDSSIQDANFLQRYISILEMNADVFIGGRVYASAAPIECNRRLHWKYGTYRESVKGKKGKMHTNNFCIRKQLFEQLEFPGFLKQYGHEDTWMGIRLEQLGKRILYIDNPVLHDGVEDTVSFLKKSQQALENLVLLAKTTNRKHLIKHVTLFKAYHKVKKFRLEFVIGFLYGCFQNKIVANLQSCNPSLLTFDFYKLYHFIQLSKVKG